MRCCGLAGPKLRLFSVTAWLLRAAGRGSQVALSTVTVLKPCREDHVTAVRCVRSSEDFLTCCDRSFQADGPTMWENMLLLLIHAVEGKTI